MRLGERGQMTDGPRYHVAVTVQIAVAARGRAQDFRDIARYGGLFSQHRNCRWIQVSRAQTTSLVATAGVGAHWVPGMILRSRFRQVRYAEIRCPLRRAAP